MFKHYVIHAGGLYSVTVITSKLGFFVVVNLNTYIFLCGNSPSPGLVQEQSVP